MNLKKVGLRKEQAKFERRMWRKLKMGGEGRVKGFVVVIEKLRFGNLAFFC